MFAAVGGTVIGAEVDDMGQRVEVGLIRDFALRHEFPGGIPILELEGRRPVDDGLQGCWPLVDVVALAGVRVVFLRRAV